MFIPMQINEKVSQVEAILFACGEPLEADKLAQAIDIELDTLPKLILMLNDRYDQAGSALAVLKLNDSYQLTTKEIFAPYIRTALETRRQQPLSNAAMEVLAIIAYNQPVTKSFIESVRSVDSSSIVNTLVERGLLEEAYRLDVPGRPIAYRTTNNFLRCFKLGRIEDLPPLPRQNEQVSFGEIESAQGYENEEIQTAEG